MDQPHGQRWEIALDLLRQRRSFSLGQMTFSRVSEERIEAALASEWQARSVTREYALAALGAARAQTQQLLATDTAFRDAIGDATVDYVLVEDYDTGSIAVCRLQGDDVEWLTPRRP